jgi:hypothetical protein
MQVAALAFSAKFFLKQHRQRSTDTVEKVGVAGAVKS